MAKRNSSKSTKTDKSNKIPYNQIKFVFNNLTETMLNEFDDSPHSKISLDDIDNHITTLIEYGYRLSVRYDDYSGAIQITATNDDANNPSGGYATSSRSTDFSDAIRILIYKILVVAENDLSSFDNQFQDVRG